MDKREKGLFVKGLLELEDLEEAKNYIGSTSHDVESLMCDIWDEVNDHNPDTLRKMCQICTLLLEAYYRLQLIAWPPERQCN